MRKQVALPFKLHFLSGCGAQLLKKLNQKHQQSLFSNRVSAVSLIPEKKGSEQRGSLSVKISVEKNMFSVKTANQPRSNQVTQNSLPMVSLSSVIYQHSNLFCSRFSLSHNKRL